MNRIASRKSAWSLTWICTNHRAFITNVAFSCVMLLLAGCSYQHRMKNVVASYERGDFNKAVRELEPMLADRRDSDNDRIIYELDAGTIYAAAHEIGQSYQALHRADDLMWKYLDDAAETRVTAIAAAILTNQTVIPYVGRSYDRIMCCTYQALNHLELGKLDAAGVSLRRAYEWQRDAVEKNAKEIEALESAANANSNEKGYDSNAAMSDPSLKGGLDSAYGPLQNMSGYAEFAIPYATYLQGVQHALTGRADALAQATYEFRRAASMLNSSDATYALQDAARCESANTGIALAPRVYVICESGMGPWLDELRIDIPLFMRQWPYIGAAFPVLKFNEGSPSAFTARAGNASYPSCVLTDMDRVVGGEFKQRLPAIIALTLVSTATKAIATYVAQQAAMSSNNNAAWMIAIAGAIYQASVNSADLRIWLTLPKRVLYASFPAPAPAMGTTTASIEIDLGDGQRIGPIATESNQSTIVHVRVPRAGVAPSIRIMRFGAK